MAEALTALREEEEEGEAELARTDDMMAGCEECRCTVILCGMGGCIVGIGLGRVICKESVLIYRTEWLYSQEKRTRVGGRMVARRRGI